MMMMMMMTSRKRPNLFLIFLGVISIMSGLPAYLKRRGTELLIVCGSEYSTNTLISISSYELFGAVGDHTIIFHSELLEP